MGYPTAYTDLYLPKLLVHILTILEMIRRLLSLTGRDEPEPMPHHPRCSPAAELIRELLPVVRYGEVLDDTESCSVCLQEFEGGDEIRRLVNCRHVFHRTCVDRWIDHDQKTCPLCRALFVQEEKLCSFCN